MRWQLSRALQLNIITMVSNNNNISDELIAAFLDGNVNEKEASQILSALKCDAEMKEILTLSPLIDEEVETHDINLPMTALAAANQANLCSFDCETFILDQHNIDIDNWTLLETAKANNWLREQGTPLHHVGRLLELKGMYVERKYDATLVDLEDALQFGKDVIAIVDNNIFEGNDTPDVNEKRLYHAIYVKNIDRNDKSISFFDLETVQDKSLDKEIFLQAWKCSGNYLVTASETLSGYNPQPINVADIELDANLEDLTEAIAENAHDIWARARLDEGWTYGPVRDDAKKEHPDLVPYAKLPESEKEYDRLIAMNTLRLVKRLGFNIKNNNL